MAFDRFLPLFVSVGGISAYLVVRPIVDWTCYAFLIYLILVKSKNFGKLLKISKSIEISLAFCRRAMVFSPCTTIE